MLTLINGVEDDFVGIDIIGGESTCLYYCGAHCYGYCSVNGCPNVSPS